MRKMHMAVLAGLCLTAAGAVAQNAHPPKVLFVDVEYVKPEMTGKPHREAEQAVTKQLADAKSPVHYFALDSLTGAPRVLFMFPYDSFAEFAKTRMEAGQNAEGSAAVDEANRKDSELLSSKESDFYRYRADLSHKPEVPIKDLHYWEITRVKVKVGHTHDWEEYLKMLSGMLDKTAPDRHLAVFQSAYGRENGGIWLLMVPMATMDAVDTLFADRDAMPGKTDAATMTRYQALAAASVESSQRNLFAAAPKMSYVSDEWAKADPFWATK